MVLIFFSAQATASSKVIVKFSYKKDRFESFSKITHIMVKVKESRNRPGVAQRVPGGLGSQIFMTFHT